MVCFVRDYHTIPDEESLHGYVRSEKLWGLFYIPAAICLSLGTLGRGGITPFTVEYEWRFYLLASIYFTSANIREAIICLQTLIRNGEEELINTSKKEWGLEAFSSVALATGSFTLGNAAILGLGGGGDMELWRRQCVLAFCLLGLGAAGNSGDGNRRLLGLMHVLMSGCFLLASVLQVPSLTGNMIDDTNAYRSHLISGTTGVGALSAILASFLYLLRVRSEMERIERICEHRRKKLEKKQQKKHAGYKSILGKVGQVVRDKSRRLLFGRDYYVARNADEHNEDESDSADSSLFGSDGARDSSFEGAVFGCSDSSETIERMEEGVTDEVDEQEERRLLDDDCAEDPDTKTSQGESVEFERKPRKSRHHRKRRRHKSFPVL